MTTDDTKTLDAKLATIRDGWRRFAQGCSDAAAQGVLDEVCNGWGMRRDHLPDVLDALATPTAGVTTNHVICWLHLTIHVGRTVSGRALILQAAKTLSTQGSTTPPAGETRH